MLINRLPRLLPISLLTAALAYFSPYVQEMSHARLDFVPFTMALTAIWAGVAGYGMGRSSGKQWMWFMIGLPFAAYHTFWFLVLNVACAYNLKNCI